MDRTILHVDLDAFFAAVEQRDRPELRGKPVIVGGGARAAAASCQRGELRGARVRRPLGDAPAEAVAALPARRLPAGRRRRYQRRQRDVMAILRRFTPLVEPISIDEAFLDVTGSRAAVRRRRDDRAARSRRTVRGEVGLTASVGVATTKLVAKIASDLRKPDGLVVVPPGEEAAFLAPLPISRLWGVGAKTRRALREYGVRDDRRPGGPARATCSSAGSASTAASLVERARGHRRRSGRRRRSGQVDRPRAHVRRRHVRPGGHRADAAGDGRRRRRAAALGRRQGASTITVKIRDSSFRTITRQRTLPEPTDLTEPIFRTALELARPEVRGLRIRLLGVTASNLGEREQLGLFARRATRGGGAAIEAADAIRRRFGERCRDPGRLVGAGLPAPFERDPRNPLERRARGVPGEATARRAPVATPGATGRRS